MCKTHGDLRSIETFGKVWSQAWSSMRKFRDSWSIWKAYRLGIKSVKSHYCSGSQNTQKKAWESSQNIYSNCE
jgi:hypothetical protein